MWLFGYLTPPVPGIEPVTIVDHENGQPAGKNMVQALARNGHAITWATEPSPTGLSIEIPDGFSTASAVHALTIHAGPNETAGERTLRYETEALLMAPPGVQNGNPAPHADTGFQRTVPAYLIMFLTMNLLVSGAGFAEERNSGRLRRLFAASIPKVSIVFGRLGSRLVIAWLQMLVLFGIGVLVFHIQLSQHPIGVLVILTLYTLAMGTVGILFGTFFKDPDKAQAFAMWTALLLAPFAGLWWPIELMPKPLIAVAACLPTGWAMQTVNSMMTSDTGLKDCSSTMFALAALAAVATMLATRFLDRTTK